MQLRHTRVTEHNRSQSGAPRIHLPTKKRRAELLPRIARVPSTHCATCASFSSGPQLAGSVEPLLADTFDFSKSSDAR